MKFTVDIPIPAEINIYITLRGINLADFIAEINGNYKTLSEYYTAERRALIKRIDRLI